MQTDTKSVRSPYLLRLASLAGQEPDAYLRSLLKKHGTRTAVASELFVTQRTINSWCRQVGITSEATA